MSYSTYNSYSASSSAALGLFVITPSSSPRETHETYEQLWHVLRPSTTNSNVEKRSTSSSTSTFKKFFKGF
ncbi:hypothetical protein D9758_008144 [Tetrapyrgos nigripes]|uniref:Uncharacterized protein n=1 Tax=Tetrapyrgos nigripes TaxID=182062 RepID=A0A8H5LPR9_9AGAR|nr:hypothetical protein D9758_015093 [Tetrapyrgos nigripes]KAF5336705.1 hypothetical protein D9758_015090 [Tetrapyrgos nigripes]KAF5364911.1 hypothetical protein D9758_008144 [Tetrapyrgos nigripes]